VCTHEGRAVAKRLGARRWSAWVRGGKGVSAPTLPRATQIPISGSRTPVTISGSRKQFCLCFQVPIFEALGMFVYRARVSAQKTPQTPGKAPIFEKSADQCTYHRTCCVVPPISQELAFFRGFGSVFCALAHAQETAKISVDSNIWAGNRGKDV